MNYFKLAWRNIWRNKKRTLITAGSVFFALILSILMIGLQKGVFNNMIKVSVEDFYGYIQVHKQGYSNDKSLINTLIFDKEIQDYLLAHKNVAEIHPRIETFCLSAFGNKTKGVPIIGVNPEMEFEKPGLKKRLIAGVFPTTQNGGLVVTEKFAEYMGIVVGDSLAFIGQGYHGVSAVGLYKVVGIIKLPNTQLNAGLVYMELGAAQELFSLENRLTSIVVRLNDDKYFKETAKELKASAPKGFEVLTWEEERPELVQLIESKAGGSQIILLILYIVVGFGIFGTALMMTAERVKEFAIMIALGMQKTKIVITVALEMILITMVGILGSIVISFPLMYYLHLNPIPLSGEVATTYESIGLEPIMPIAWDISYYLPQPFMVFIITLIAVSYPLYRIKKLDLMKSMKK
jgi:ABC-type lipoprotein release transport system permease subunit